MDSSTIFLTLIGSALIFIYLYFTRDNKYFEKLGIPFVKPTFILGNMTKSVFGVKSIPDVIQEVYDSHPEAKYVGVYDFWNPVILLKDPELIKSITVKHANSFPNHKFFTEFPAETLFQKNLLALKDDEWRNMRAILTPAFTASKMKYMFKTVTECATNFADYLAEMNPRPEEFDAKDLFGRYTYDVIASAAYGLSVNSMKDRDNDFYINGQKAGDIAGLSMLKFFVIKSLPSWLVKILDLKFLDDNASDFFINTIKDAIETRDARGIVRPDMIHLLMQARDRMEKSPLSIDDIAAQAFIFLLGGVNAPLATMSAAAHFLALNPDIQKKLQAEIDEVRKNSPGEVSYEDLAAMKYLDAVVSETLRIYAPNGAIDRVGPGDFTLPPALPGLEPLLMKPDQSIWIPIHNIHHDPRYFPEPEKFDPERFNDENKSKILPFTYFPFGLGARSCIGSRFALMEVKLALFYLLAQCSLLPSPKTPTSIILSPKSITAEQEGGFWLKIVRRKFE